MPVVNAGELGTFSPGQALPAGPLGPVARKREVVLRLLRDELQLLSRQLGVEIFRLGREKDRRDDASLKLRRNWIE